MPLDELATEYRRSAELLENRMRGLELFMTDCGELEREGLTARYRLLRNELIEVRRIEVYLAHYYDK